MDAGITFAELLAWNDEASKYWKTHLDTNPSLLDLPCDIGGAKSVQEFVRHIWAAELRWAQRLAGLPVLDRDKVPTGPLDALFQLHREAMEIYRDVLSAPAHDWDAKFVMEVDWIPAELRQMSHRKLAGHALFHSQRHWAQLATLLRQAGFPTQFYGDLLFSPALS